MLEKENLGAGWSCPSKSVVRLSNFSYADAVELYTRRLLYNTKSLRLPISESSERAQSLCKMSGICANPLYLQWIREWWDAANAHNAKDRLTYKRAWESMKAHPIEFTHPSQAMSLIHIGPKLVERLTERLETYCRDEGLDMPARSTKSLFNAPLVLHY